MPVKKGENKTKRVELAASLKFVAYLDDLIKMEGFGNSHGEVVRRFAWDAINKLIADRRLKQR